MVAKLYRTPHTAPRKAPPKRPVWGQLLLLCFATLPAASVGSFQPQHVGQTGESPLFLAGLSDIQGAGKLPEQQLMRILDAMRRGELNQAQQQLDALLAAHPNYRLANLIQGDLLRARTKPIRTLGDISVNDVAALNDLRDEAKLRLQRYVADAPRDQVPTNLLAMAPSQKYVLAVDVKRARLYVYANENGVPRRVDDFYVTIGKNGFEKSVEGDQRTPLGVYFVTSQLPKDTLPDLYGIAAFPLSYPNEWDKRQGKTGHGIWLHGSPSDTYSRPPRSSNGCVALTNTDLVALSRYLQVGVTPVIIAQDFTWAAASNVGRENNGLLAEIETWRTDWETRDAQRLTRHYSPSFRSGTLDLAAWAAQKTAINQSRAWIKVKVSDLSLFRYPGQPNLVVATFRQDYQSDALSSQGWKRQYWLREGGAWRIVSEDVV